MKKEKLQVMLQTQLVDDKTPFAGETFGDFIADPDFQPLWKKIVLPPECLHVIQRMLRYSGKRAGRLRRWITC